LVRNLTAIGRDRADGGRGCRDELSAGPAAHLRIGRRRIELRR
jgi:hypothetical protein